MYVLFVLFRRLDREDQVAGHAFAATLLATTGRALDALSLGEAQAESLGIDSFRVRLLVFTIAGLLAHKLRLALAAFAIVLGVSPSKIMATGTTATNIVALFR